jgi:hypothetical protein
LCVTTWHNDIGRTGQNISEGTLTTTLVGNQAIFGRKCSYPLLTDERVYAEPLVVTNVLLQGQTQAKTVVYVLTMLDNIYAFDGVKPCRILPAYQRDTPIREAIDEVPIQIT